MQSNNLFLNRSTHQNLFQVQIWFLIVRQICYMMFQKYNKLYLIMGKIIENYSLQHQLGSGVYSKVYKAINIKTKQQVAIKMVKADKFKELPKLEEGTVNQINILSNLDYCPHIIKYYDMLKTVNNFYFVYEFCNGGTLQALLKKEGPLPQKAALTYFAQIVEAFRVLNKHNIMHRDLKPDNILINNGILKLADFGFCKPLQNQNDTTKTMLGSPIYMAPQILKGQTYTIKADIWSLGVVLFRMLYGFCPFQSNNIGKLIMIIDKQEIKIPQKPEVSHKMIVLLKKMLTKNASFRADWSQIFSYEIKNGQIINSSILSKKSFNNLTDSGLKGSLAPTLESSITPRLEYGQMISSSQKDFVKMRPQDINGNQHSGSGIQSLGKTDNRQDLMFNPRDKNMRSTYTTKCPLRQNLKKDMMLKNHSKCIQLTSVLVNLCQYDCAESLILAYIFALNVQKQLNTIIEAIRKQSDIKSMDQMFMKTFYHLVEQQIQEIRINIQTFQEQIRNFTDVNLQMVEARRKQYLKKFINSLKYQNIDELVMAARVLDLLEDSLVIRRFTYEKMSREQLAKKIKDKIETINDF